MILETCCYMIKKMNLSFDNNYVIINNKSFMKFMIWILIFKKEWCICRISNAVNIRVYILSNNRLEITDHSVSKNIILQKSTLQIVKLKILCKLYQDIKMKHFLTIYLNNIIMICNLLKNINLFSIRSNKIIKKDFTDMIEELSNSH